jgi:hypothetical protein
MPWQLLRLTTNLTADGAWHGLARSSASAPASNRTGDAGATIFVPVGGGSSTARVWDGQSILVRLGWCDTDGQPLAGAGTRIDAQPVTIDALPHPTAPGQYADRLSVGEVRQGVAWEPLYLRVGPATIASVRLSAMDGTGVTGAARVAVWVWVQ